MHRRNAPLLAATVSATLLLSGCSSGQRTGSMQQVIADYEAQRYAQSLTGARALARSSSASTREQASYMAGLNAYKLGQREEAERSLLVAAGSRDTELAAKANAMLGVIKLEQHKSSEAVVLLEKAHPGLSASDASQAARQLARANQQLGNSSEANRWHTRTASTSTGSSPGVTAIPAQVSTTDRVSTELFALQVGAFRSREHAESAAAMASRLADKHGLGPMRIIPSRDDRGQTLYLVQFGRFPTRTAAATSRERLGKLDYIVAPLALPST